MINYKIIGSLLLWKKVVDFLQPILDEITKNNKADYAVVYCEFMYQAGHWPYERRVVCKV